MELRILMNIALLINKLESTEKKSRNYGILYKIHRPK